LPAKKKEAENQRAQDQIPSNRGAKIWGELGRLVNPLGGSTTYRPYDAGWKQDSVQGLLEYVKGKIEGNFVIGYSNAQVYQLSMGYLSSLGRG